MERPGVFALGPALPAAVGIISAATGEPPSRKMSMVAEIERVLGIRKATSGQPATFSKNA